MYWIKLCMYVCIFCILSPLDYFLGRYSALIRWSESVVSFCFFYSFFFPSNCRFNQLFKRSATSALTQCTQFWKLLVINRCSGVRGVFASKELWSECSRNLPQNSYWSTLLVTSITVYSPPLVKYLDPKCGNVISKLLFQKWLINTFFIVCEKVAELLWACESYNHWFLTLGAPFPL